MESDIILRGHHIGLLAELLFGNPYADIEPYHHDPFFPDINHKFNYFLKPDIIPHEDKLYNKLYDSNLNCNIIEYKKFNEYKLKLPPLKKPLPPTKELKKPLSPSKSILQLILSRSDLKIQIVDGIDSVCNLCTKEPPYPFESCTQTGGEDTFCSDEYGLKVGKTYTASEILDKLKEYNQETGLRSPRGLWSMKLKSEREKMWLEMIRKET